MKLSLTRALTGVTALAFASGVLLGAAGAAFAGPTTSPFDPPAAQTLTNNNGATQGLLSFYDAAGAKITGGPLSAPPEYIKADTDKGRTASSTTVADTLATAFIYTPVKGQNAGQWSGEQISASDDYVGKSLPGRTSDGTALVFSAFMWTQEVQVQNANTDPAWQDLYQVRILTSGTGQAVDDTRYASATVSVDPAAGTWTQVYPTPPAPATAPGAPTGVVATPQQNGASVAFSPPVSDGGAPITGYTVTSNGTTMATATGSASPVVITGLAPGSYTFTVQATNSAGTSAPSDASAPVDVTDPPAPNVALSVAGGPTTSDPYTFTASVTPTAAAGSVQFFDNGSATPLPGTTGGSNGTYTLSNVTLPAGQHSVVATFTPTDPNAYSASSSVAQTFFTQPPPTPVCADPLSKCTDPQNIRVEVPVGTLIISTPYTPTSPLDLGVMTLDQRAKMYSASATFADIVVTDTRAGDLPWTVQALSGNLSNGGSATNSLINSQNVGLTGITTVNGTGFVGTVTPFANPAADPAVAPADPGNLGLGGSAPHTVATADKGSGTVTMSGQLRITAPTSTERGVYDGLVTFTVG